MFMAGGGVRGGYTHDETDEIGWNPARDPVHINDLQATMLKQFGIGAQARSLFTSPGQKSPLTSCCLSAKILVPHHPGVVTARVQ